MMSIESFIMGYLSPLYEIGSKYLPMLIILIGIILCVWIGIKIKNSFPRKSGTEDTNDWFSWEEFKEWKRKKKFAD